MERRRMSDKYPITDFLTKPILHASAGTRESARILVYLLATLFIAVVVR